MRNDTMYKTRLALACGALLALGLAGCNREREQMDTEPAASATAVTEPMPPPPMTPAAPMPTSPMTPAMPSTAIPPPPTTAPATGEVMPNEEEANEPMESTTQPADDAGAPPTR
jgi:hypothetical protein